MRKPGIFDPWRQEEPAPEPPPEGSMMDALEAEGLTEGEDPTRVVALRGKRAGLNVLVTTVKQELEVPLACGKLCETYGFIPEDLRKKHGITKQVAGDKWVTFTHGAQQFYVATPGLDGTEALRFAVDKLAETYMTMQRNKDLAAKLTALGIDPWRNA